MLQGAVREDALTAVAGGYELRVGLPWIRSMPLSSIRGLVATLDGRPAEELGVRLGTRAVPGDALAAESVWWFIQDRLVLVLPDALCSTDGQHHEVSVDFELMVPYLQAGGDGPLVLPIHLEARLAVSPAVRGGASRDVS
ncbi:hypothetical protein AAHB33_02295 [Paenarthrobacter sp. S56]|uniref:hypothetical protein n=1 Tax=Paenarthrobacter sp. S56 TaxID=3138179 RepID=UPI00321968A9